MTDDAAHKTFSMRLDTQLLDRIDHNAKTAGLTRTAYVLSYLPETYEQPAHSTPDAAQAAPSNVR